MRRLHLLIGSSALTAFLASGAYMELHFHHLSGFDEATRLLFRSTHIYLLFAALLNLALGTCAERRDLGWRRWTRRIGSVLVMVAPILCVLAFLREPWLTRLSRPYTVPAVIICVAGVLCHVVSNSRK